MEIKLAALVLVVTVAISAMATLAARRLALKLNLVSIPRADRYGRKVIPLGGGMGIFATLALACLASMAVVRWLWIPGHLGDIGADIGLDPSDFMRRLNELLMMLGCTTAFFILGLWDDFKRLGPMVKLAAQFAIALVAAFGADVRVELFIHNTALTSILSACWIVLMVNTFNFLDNMDGASAGIATICASVLLTAAVFSGQILVAGLALVFIGTLIGFLFLNFPPARIYMGDSGSLVVGFFMAVLSLRTTYYHEAHSGSWYPVLLPSHRPGRAALRLSQCHDPATQTRQKPVRR